ncbi:MAG: leucine-rich repeat protein [Candidatus Onthomonas sp.]
MTKCKKLLALLLTLAIVLSMVPVTALAVDEKSAPVEAADTAGTELLETEDPVPSESDVQEEIDAKEPTQLASDEVTVVNTGVLIGDIIWELDSANTLTLKGSGGMPTNEGENYFGIVQEEIDLSIVRSIVVEDGITALNAPNNGAFRNLTNLTLANSVISIYGNFFEALYDLENVTVCGYTGSYAQLYAEARGVTFESLGTGTVPSGQFGIDNLNWSIENHVLTISGNGSMTPKTDDMDRTESLPWNSIVAILTGVEIGTGVTDIYFGSFSSAKQLEHVSLPEGLTSIGGYSFRYCSSLESIEIPSTVKTIGDYAFSNCTSLSSVTFLGDTPTFGTNAFENTPWFQNTMGDFVITDGVLYSYQGSDTSVEIPDTVTAIADSAFKECTDLESVIIPGSVVTIGDSAFAWCDNLKTVVLSEGLQQIGDSAFISTALADITIPESVTTIGSCAFEYCPLKSVTIPRNVTSIGDSVFSSCTSLTNAVISEGITSLGNAIFFDCAQLQDVTLPTTLTSIPDSAFDRCVSLETIEIPNSVTEIGDLVFRDCENLTSVIMSDHITAIGFHAFQNCTSLLEIELPSTMTEMDSCAFENCAGLREVIIPGSLTYISSSSFSGCSALESITLSEGVTEIANNAFENCTSLTSITIPSSVRRIHTTAFLGCTGLESVFVAQGNEVFASLDGVLYNIDLTELLYYPSGKQGVLEIADGVTSIGDNAFRGQAGLEQIVLPGSVTSIGSYAFSRCTNLTAIVFPDGLKSIGQGAFSACTSLKDADLPAGLEKLERYAFQSCSSLEDVLIPSGIGTIEYEVFYGCSSLQTLVIAEGITDIGNGAFYSCTSLMEVSIPGSVCKIGALSGDFDSMDDVGSFEGCSRLADVTIGNGVESIGVRAFADCTTLNTIAVPSTVSAIENEAFSGCVSLSSVTFADDIDSLQIGNSVFSNCTALNDIVLPSCIKQISSQVFSECTSLSSIVIPNSVTQIGSKAFFNCTSLTSIVVPSSVTQIGIGAFVGCSGLQDVVLQGSDEVVESSASVMAAAADGTSTETSTETFVETSDENGIASRAFYNCNNLEKITFETRTISIGEEAIGYSDLGKLQNVTIYGYRSSTAETYAAENDISFIALDEPAPTENPFTDVKESEYYYDAVLWAYENGIASGVTSTTFRPEASCTRGQMVTFLWRAMGEPEPETAENPFTDVKENEYYYKPVLWAYENGIASGITSTTFQPNAAVTRGQAVTFLWRAEGTPSASVANPFTDVKDSEYYFEAVLWAYENGITSGATETLFKPAAACTRGQVVTFLYRDMG